MTRHGIKPAAEPATPTGAEGMTPAKASAQYRLGYRVGYDAAAAGERSYYAAEDKRATIKQIGPVFDCAGCGATVICPPQLCEDCTTAEDSQ